MPPPGRMALAASESRVNCSGHRGQPGMLGSAADECSSVSIEHRAYAPQCTSASSRIPGATTSRDAGVTQPSDVFASSTCCSTIASADRSSPAPPSPVVTSTGSDPEASRGQAVCPHLPHPDEESTRLQLQVSVLPGEMVQTLVASGSSRPDFQTPVHSQSHNRDDPRP